MKVYILTLMIILTSNWANAQSFYDGYVIDNNRDTLWGKIQTDSEKEINLKIMFKNEGNEIVQSYTPFEIKGFGLQNFMVYESRKVENVHRFVKILIRGDLSVFSISEDSLEGIYLEWNNSIKKLEEKRTEYQEGGIDKSRISPDYVKILEGIFGECRPNVWPGNVDEKPIQNLFEGFYQCTGISYEKFGIHLSGIKGITFASVYAPIRGERFLQGAISVSWLLPRFNQRVGYMVMIRGGSVH